MMSIYCSSDRCLGHISDFKTLTGTTTITDNGDKLLFAAALLTEYLLMAAPPPSG